MDKQVSWSLLAKCLKSTCGILTFQGYLRYKTIFCNELTLDVWLMNFFI